MSEQLLTEEDIPEDISVDGSESLYIPSDEDFEDSEEEYRPKNKSRKKNTGKRNGNENEDKEENSERVDTTSEEESEDSEEEYQHKNKSRRKNTRKGNDHENEENSESIDTPSEGEPADDEIGQTKSKSRREKIDRRSNNGGFKAGDKGVKKMDKIEARCVIRYLYIKGKNSREIHKNIKDIYGDSAPSYDTVVRWRRHFNGGSKILSDKPRSGRPSLADVEDIVKKVEKYLQEDNKMTIHAIMDKTKLGYGTVWKIIHDELHMCKKNECWVPCADAINEEREA